MERPGILEQGKVDRWVDDTIPLSAHIFENVTEKGFVVLCVRVGAESCRCTRSACGEASFRTHGMFVLLKNCSSNPEGREEIQRF